MSFNSFDDRIFDVVVIGGGINGAGIAADAALRGLSVLLCEQGDLASQTSSSSSKLIHGGVRYLEQFHFKLVKKALNERALLHRLAPHLVQPIPMIIPHQSNVRKAWWIRAGLFIYDHLSAANRLPHSRFVQRTSLQPTSNYFTPLKEGLSNGFLFYDCKTDDARLTLSNAVQATMNGATIVTQTTFIDAKPRNSHWQLRLETGSGQIIPIQARSIINATGPWVLEVNKRLGIPDDHHHSLSFVKGSHLVVHKLYDGEHAYVLQQDDQRIVFVIPFQGHSLIGTTEIPIKAPIRDVSIEPSEIDYLLSMIHRYFRRPIAHSDIITHWSGIRPLLVQPSSQSSHRNDHPSHLSREYACVFSNQPAPVVTIYGGKITTYRRLAQEAVDHLSTIFPNLPASTTHKTMLPGAQFGEMTLAQYQSYAKETYHWLNQPTMDRYFKTYGTRMEMILASCHRESDLGLCFFDTLYQVEIDYLIQHEWATSLDDVLWRRTKLGLIMKNHDHQQLVDYIRYAVSQQ